MINRLSLFRPAAVKVLASLCALALPAVGLTVAAPAVSAVEVPAAAQTSGTATPEPAPTEPVATEPVTAEPSTPATSEPAPETVERVELVEKRTASSRTYRLPDGSLQAEVFSDPVHYRDTAGDWAPIENTLVDAAQDGYAVENEANDYRLLVPADAGSDPVTVEADGEWVSFAADGADGAPVVDGPTATIEGIAPATSLEYEATNEGVKETIVLDAAPAAGAQPEYVFELATSPGVTPKLVEDGGLRFVDEAGEVVFVSPAPFMVDSSDVDGEAAYSADVAYTLTANPAGAGWSLTVTPSTAWLADPARVYPVMIDPTVTEKPADTDCWLNQADPTTPFCGAASSYIRVGRDAAGNKRRGLVDFDLPAEIPVNATVTDAKLSLYLDSGERRTSTEGDYVARKVTQSWTGATTWNTRDGFTSWTTTEPPEGEITFGGVWKTDTGGEVKLGDSGTTSGYKTWNVKSIAADWVATPATNFGFIIKQAAETTNNSLGFYSSDYVDLALAEDGAERHPKLTITWDPAARETSEGIGARRFFTFEEQSLNDRMTAKVNVANGNLLLAARDLSIAGTGLDATVQRFYNSLSTATDDNSGLGAGWVLGDAPTVRLESPTGTAPGTHSTRVMFVGPSGYKAQFDKNTAGGYVRPAPGIDADLTYLAGTGEYRLDWHDKTRYFFAAADGLLRHQQDKQGNQITYTYQTPVTADSRLDYATDTQGRKIDFTYDSNDRLESVTDVAGGRTYVYGYDAASRLASSKITSYGLGTDTLNLGAATSYGYDSSGRLDTITDAKGNLTRLTYDGTTRKVHELVRVTADPAVADPTTTFTYLTAPATGCDAPGVKTSTKVDGPRTDVTDVTTYCLDDDDRVVQVIDAKAHKRATTYDSNSNVVNFNDSGTSGGASTTNTYAGDNLEKVALPAVPGKAPATATAKYTDPNNPHFPTSVKDYATDKASTATGTWDYTYDNNGNLTRATNPAKAITYQYCYDGKGQLQRIDAPPITTLLDTDTTTGCGTANQGNDTLLAYDPQGNLTAVDEPGSNRDRTFTYDAVSRVRTITDGRGVVTTYTYDALDRVTKLDYTQPIGGTLPGFPSVTYTYDTAGNLLEVDPTNGANTSYTYDELNRPITESPQDDTAATVTYTYDTAGNLKTIKDQDEPAPVTYAYDNLNRVISVTDQNADPNAATQPDPAHTTTFEYNKHDLRTKTTYPTSTDPNNPNDKVVMEQKYDEARRLRCIYAYKGTPPTGSGTSGCPAASPTLLTFYSYTYENSLGMDTMSRQSETNRDSDTITYTYDDIARLERAVTKNSAATTLRDYLYAHGPRSNITKETVTGTAVPNTVTRFEYNDAGELCWTLSTTTSADCSTTPTGATTYSHDQAGNLTGSSAGLSLDYNLQGQTTSITPPGGQAFAMTYANVTSDRRTSAGDTQMGYNLLGLAAQGTTGAPHTDWFVRDPNGTLLARVDRNDTSKDLYYLFDGLGSVRATIDQNGTIVNRYIYEPYGEQLNLNPTDTNPWRYASGYYDKTTGMIKFGTRYYMPNLARWTQPDPVPGRPSNPPSLNPYNYVGCNPINAVDLAGRAIGDYLESCTSGSIDSAITGAAAGGLAGAVGGPLVFLAGITGGAAVGAFTGCFEGLAVQGVRDLYGQDAATVADFLLALNGSLKSAKDIVNAWF